LLLPVRLWGWASGKVLRVVAAAIMWWLRLLGLGVTAAPAAAAAGRRGERRHQHVR